MEHDSPKVIQAKASIKRWEQILKEDMDIRVDKANHAMIEQSVSHLVASWYQLGIEVGKRQSLDALQAYVEDTKD